MLHDHLQGLALPDDFSKPQFRVDFLLQIKLLFRQPLLGFAQRVACFPQRGDVGARAGESNPPAPRVEYLFDRRFEASLSSPTSDFPFLPPPHPDFQPTPPALPHSRTLP